MWIEKGKREIQRSTQMGGKERYITLAQWVGKGEGRCRALCTWMGKGNREIRRFMQVGGQARKRDAELYAGGWENRKEKRGALHA